MSVKVNSELPVLTLSPSAYILWEMKWLMLWLLSKDCYFVDRVLEIPKTKARVKSGDGVSLLTEFLQINRTYFGIHVKCCSALIQFSKKKQSSGSFVLDKPQTALACLSRLCGSSWSSWKRGLGYWNRNIWSIQKRTLYCKMCGDCFCGGRWNQTRGCREHSRTCLQNINQFGIWQRMNGLLLGTSGIIDVIFNATVSHRKVRTSWDKHFLCLSVFFSEASTAWEYGSTWKRRDLRRDSWLVRYRMLLLSRKSFHWTDRLDYQSGHALGIFLPGFHWDCCRKNVRFF